MVPPLVHVFGEVPWRTYTTLVMVDQRSLGGAGLEHQNSHVDVVTPLGLGTDWLASLYAHEIAHAWNVKRLRPAEMVPYRYDVPQPTPWLWVSEGVTDYYADLALVRGGITTPEDFAETTTNKIAEVDSVPAVALEDASLSTWISPVDGTATIYYAKGSLAGLLLDVMIRDASDDRGSLDAVLRTLYDETWKRGRGFTGDDWWGAVKRAARVEGDAARARGFDDFRARFIDGRERFPYDSVLPLAGFRLVADTTRAPRLGIGFSVDSAGALINEVAPGGAASVAGVRAGDVLLAVGDVALSDPDFAARFSRTFRGGDAQTVLRVRRGGQALALPVKVPLVALVSRRVELDSSASPKARRIRDSMLSGK
jgi:predicted metalloprotease with PDZ domain